MTVSSDYTEELWQACAGPFVAVPKVNQRVWYFPQGHMEQVAAGSMQAGVDQQVSQPISSDHPVPSQILCRIVHLSLSAEPDTDEVYAQLSLLPECCQMCDTTASPEEPAPLRNNSVRLFNKILTASDTSTHGGFSVLRKHAEDCLPPLDMSSEIPTQELTATDLHGKEWKFRHTYRGRPQRHLLTTGWSYFVSQKRLVAGDVVIFLRGEDGKIRVGIRRAKRWQSNPTFNVLTSHSMRMGIIATAAYAWSTKTMFGVYYKPRASPSPFVVPVEHVARSLSRNLTVGTRFKMRFESEDGTERSFSGTITGTSDVDSVWPNSKWRSLIVNWDEVAASERQDRLSPWEIEVCVSMVNSLSAPKSKRICSSHSTVCAQGRMYETSISSTESWLPQKHSLPKKNLAGLPVTLVDDGQRSMGASSEISSGMDGQAQACDHVLQHQQSSFFNPFTPEVAPEPSFNIMKTAPLQSYGVADRNEVQTSMYAWQPLSTGNISSSWATLSAGLSSAPWEQHHSKEKVTSPNGCKLFGCDLTQRPSSTLNKRSDEEHVTAEVSSHGPNLCIGAVRAVSQSKSCASDHEKSDNTVQKSSRGVDIKSNKPGRSCTKVIMKGNTVGRGVDLSKFDSYKMLIEELEGMFHIRGQLNNPESRWQVAYSDDEGDMMHVGDDPWMEFCTMVRKIYIFSPEEIECQCNAVFQELPRQKACRTF